MHTAMYKLGSKLISLCVKGVFLIALFLVLTTCQGGGGKRLPSLFEHGEEAEVNSFSLIDILQAGELIAGTLSGPDTYFTYRDRGFGLQFELAETFARSIGTQLRMEVARDTAELLAWLRSGEVDVAVMKLPEADSTLRCRTQWLVASRSSQLRDAIDEWYDPELLAHLEKQQAERRQQTTVRRKARPQMLNAGKGVISKYDALLQRYATSIGWDWRLLAAQCYQESAFDPHAVSWAGARGLMQIMPATGERLGLVNPWDPEQNIAAAVTYLRQLEGDFSDIGDRQERINFVLAAYNGGTGHVRDAMALTRLHGGNPQRWREVEQYILLLQRPQYYTAPCVRYGYLVGSETADYVKSVRERWRTYCGQASRQTAAPQQGKPNTKVRPKESFMVDSL